MSDARASKVVLDAKRGSAYDDLISERYHFPSRYLRPMRAALGGWAVFRRPRDEGRGIAYFGVGRVSEVEADPDRPGFHYARIADYLAFPDPVPWRADERYAERALRELPDVSKVGVYLRGRSVRLLEDADFVQIVDAGFRVLTSRENARRWWTNGLPVEEAEDDEVRQRERRLIDRSVRDAAFRRSVCEAYDDRCAVTRLRIVNGGGRSEVQAAHIRPVSAGGPDIVRNGLALSGTAHWLFDRHLISIDPDYRLLVAHNRVPSEYRDLLAPAAERIHLPVHERLRPSERFMAHHRARFAAGR